MLPDFPQQGKMKRLARDMLVLVGITALALVLIALFIIWGEQSGLITVALGPGIMGLPPMDSWLIIILCVYAPGIFIAAFLLYRFKLLNLEAETKR